MFERIRSIMQHYWSCELGQKLIFLGPTLLMDSINTWSLTLSCSCSTGVTEVVTGKWRETKAWSTCPQFWEFHIWLCIQPIAEVGTLQSTGAWTQSTSFWLMVTLSVVPSARIRNSSPLCFQINKSVLRGQAVLQSQNILRESMKLCLIHGQLLQISSTFMKNWAWEEAVGELFAVWLLIWPHASGFSWMRSPQWEAVRTFFLPLLCFGLSFSALSVVLTITNILPFWCLILSQGWFFLAVSHVLWRPKQLRSNTVSFRASFQDCSPSEIGSTSGLINV